MSPQPSDEENSDNSNECVVCLSDLRDTLILPCRHLCLCNSCADTLRYQASNCPICRLREWGRRGRHRQGPHSHGQHRWGGRTRSRRDCRPVCAGSCRDAISDSELLKEYTGQTQQFSSVAQSCPTLCDPMDHSTPGLHHQLLELIQTHVHRVGDGIQPSHPLPSPSSAFSLCQLLLLLSLSQHQGLFK